MTVLRFGIFIPCYNASSTISLTLSSVQEAILKTKLDIPVFVYDDCSTDNSVETANNAWYLSSPFSVVRNRDNSGERKTTNTAFNYFRDHYDWIFIIHADDIVKDNWLVDLVEIISSSDQQKCFTVWSSYDTFNDSTGRKVMGDNSGVVHAETRTYDTIKYFLSKVYCDWHISGAAINLRLFHLLNGFDVQMAQFGDTDFFVRGLLAGYTDIYLSKTLTLYRISQGSVSSVSLRTNRDVREIVYLVDKFKSILNSNEISSMHRIVRRLSVRRMVKGLIHGNVAAAMFNFKQLGTYLLK